MEKYLKWHRSKPPRRAGGAHGEDWSSPVRRTVSVCEPCNFRRNCVRLGR